MQNITRHCADLANELSSIIPSKLSVLSTRLEQLNSDLKFRHRSGDPIMLAATLDKAVKPSRWTLRTTGLVPETVRHRVSQVDLALGIFAGLGVEFDLLFEPDEDGCSILTVEDLTLRIAPKLGVVPGRGRSPTTIQVSNDSTS